jgi:hypothetical protein
MRSFLIYLLNVSAVALAQPVSVGLVGGAGVTQDFENNIFYFSSGSAPITNYSTPKRLIVGGMLEARLPLHVSIEVDGLYHELEFTFAGVEPNGTLNSVSPSPVVTWEFPILAKYRFSLPLVKPFVEAGPSFRSSGNLNGTLPSNHGFAAGLGAEARLWKLKIAPQFRYLRWAEDPRSSPYFAPFTKPDQVELLVSVSY